MATVPGCDRAGPQVDAGRAGLATLAAGAVTVAAPQVTANSVVLITPQSGGAPLALPWVSARTAGTSFSITSLNVTDTAKVGWFFVEP